MDKDWEELQKLYGSCDCDMFISEYTADGLSLHTKLSTPQLLLFKNQNTARAMCTMVCYYIYYMFIGLNYR